MEVIEINEMAKSFGRIIVRNIKTVFDDNLDNLELIATTLVVHTRDGIMPVSFRNLENGSNYSTVVLGRLSSKRYVAINYWMEAKDEITVWLPPDGEDFSVSLFKKKSA